jgi:hypothetical protein
MGRNREKAEKKQRRSRETAELLGGDYYAS